MTEQPRQDVPDLSRMLVSIQLAAACGCDAVRLPGREGLFPWYAAKTSISRVLSLVEPKIVPEAV